MPDKNLHKFNTIVTLLTEAGADPVIIDDNSLTIHGRHVRMDNEGDWYVDFIYKVNGDQLLETIVHNILNLAK